MVRIVYEAFYLACEIYDPCLKGWRSWGDNTKPIDLNKYHNPKDRDLIIKRWSLRPMGLLFDKKKLKFNWMQVMCLVLKTKTAFS